MDLPPHPGLQGQQQRPSLSYFVFLSILFWVISNNNSPGEAYANSDERDHALERMTNQLHLREAKREGLAQWLGQGNMTLWNETHTVTLDNGTTVPTNASYALPISFRPERHVNAALLPRIEQVSAKPTPRAYYPQNVTGFIRGDWMMEQDWTLEKLGLHETFNTTELRLVEEPRNDTTTAAKAKQPARVEDNPASPAQIVRRQVAEPVDTRGTAKVPAQKWVNVTITTNRTETRRDFPFEHGGKVSFNLREEQTSAVGPIEELEPGRTDGELLQLRTSGIKAEWEKAGPVTYLKGDVTLTAKNGYEELVLDIEGMHFLSQGAFYAFATPSFVSSHLFDAVGLASPDLSSFGNLSTIAAGHVALKEVDRRLVEDRKELEERTKFGGVGVGGGGSEGSGSSSTPACTFTLYGSIAPLPSWYSPSLYAEYYASLFHPTGSSLPDPPTPSVKYLLYSDECGVVLSGEAELLLTVSLWNRATTYAILTGFSQACILLLLVRQMERSGPGSTAKIAYTTVGAQGAMDAYFFIIQFTVGVVTNTRASLPLLVPAFFALASSLIFGMRYAASIKAAAPPPPARPRPPPPPTTAQLAARAAETRAAGEADPPATAAVAPPATSEPSNLPYLLVGLVGAVTACTIIIIYGWISLIVILLFSYWIPQIVLNTQRGAARMTLRREYVIGTTLARLALPTYFWGYSRNVLAIETSPWIFALILYSGAQATTLVLQDSRLGARFFLPRFAIDQLGLTELETWNYHPLLPSLDDLEAGLSSSTDKLHAKEDCPICLSPIQLKPSKEEEATVGGLAARDKLRWSFMVPPCHHVAHTECLTHWLGVKSVCPVCRARLPPL